MFTTQFCCFSIASLARIDDASNRPTQVTSSNLGSPNGSGSDLDGLGSRHAITLEEMPSSLSCAHKKRNWRKSLLSQEGCAEWNHMSQIHLEDLHLDLLRVSRISSRSLHACASSKQVDPWVDVGLHLDRLMAPQPQGPMTRVI